MNRALCVAAVFALGLGLVACDQKDAAKPAAKAADAATKAGEMATKAGEAATKAGEAVKASLTDDVKSKLTGYLDQLTKTNGLLEGVKSPADLTAKGSELLSAVTSLSSSAGVLNALPADVQKLLTGGDSKDRIAALATTFKDQVSRLMNSDTLKAGASALGLDKALSGVKLLGAN
jgi:hypothetical protein